MIGLCASAIVLQFLKPSEGQNLCPAKLLAAISETRIARGENRDDGKQGRSTSGGHGSWGLLKERGQPERVVIGRWLADQHTDEVIEEPSNTDAAPHAGGHRRRHQHAWAGPVAAQAPKRSRGTGQYNLRPAAKP